MKVSAKQKMAAIMLCTCSGDQSKFEEMPRSPESLATLDFSANGSSRTGNREATPDDSHVNEVESFRILLLGFARYQNISFLAILVIITLLVVK